jgi:hypothetical protein
MFFSTRAKQSRIDGNPSSYSQTSPTHLGVAHLKSNWQNFEPIQTQVDAITIYKSADSSPAMKSYLFGAKGVPSQKIAMVVSKKSSTECSTQLLAGRNRKLYTISKHLNSQSYRINSHAIRMVLSTAFCKLGTERENVTNVHAGKARQGKTWQIVQTQTYLDTFASYLHHLGKNIQHRWPFRSFIDIQWPCALTVEFGSYPNQEHLRARTCTSVRDSKQKNVQSSLTVHNLFQVHDCGSMHPTCRTSTV